MPHAHVTKQLVFVFTQASCVMLSSTFVSDGTIRVVLWSQALGERYSLVYKEQLLTSGAVGVLSPQPASSTGLAIYHTVGRTNMETMIKVEDARGV